MTQLIGLSPLHRVVKLRKKIYLHLRSPAYIISYHDDGCVFECKGMTSTLALELVLQNCIFVPSYASGKSHFYSQSENH